MQNLKTRLKSLSKVEKGYFIFLIILVILPFLAPILSAVGLHFLSKPIYFLYSFFCHQFDTRSLHLFDYQVAWCARDMGIWFGVLAASIAFKIKFIKPIKWYWIFIFMLPIALDGGIQTIDTINGLDRIGILRLDEHGHLSNNLLRFLTGSFFGIGLGLLITPRVVYKDNVTNWMNIPKLEFKEVLRILSIVLILVFVYVLLVRIWDVTSNKYEPTNNFDSTAKAPQGIFFIRRAHGECPVNATESMLALDCLF